ncbi:GspH/FimT family pseudopilin [Acidiferrobacter sp.]|uniref:GspH/FimT family pseudopilin n=1 Tax=Acidiferrobacter sp. TaxID=1872107 RepID=UPI0026381AC0|nr:GspH/FimT family pseudopilin [Acidiferrobacter sp.]
MVNEVADRGFTLFETLIVLALIGIMLAVVAPRFGQEAGPSARRAGARLISLLRASRLQALVTGRSYRVVFYRHGYAFQRRDGKGRFDAVRGTLFRARHLPAGMAIRGIGRRHAVVFRPSGLVRAFRIGIVARDGRFVVRGNGDGRIQGWARGGRPGVYAP